MDCPDEWAMAGPAPYFGHWNSVYSRYSDWMKVGVFQKIFEAVSDDADMEYVMIDGTVVRVHRHGQGAKGGPEARRSDVVCRVVHQDHRHEKRQDRQVIRSHRSVFLLQLSIHDNSQQVPINPC
mgnify:CR=1 FL=1